MMKKLLQNTGVRILLVAAIITILASACLMHFNRISTRDNAAKVTYTHEVLLNIEKLLSYLKEVETTYSNYLLIKDDAYLRPFKEGKESIRKSLSDLKKQTSDIPVQQERLDVISGLVDEKFSEMSVSIQTANDSASLAQSMAKIHSAEGSSEIDQIQTLATEMKATERELLAQREATLARSQDIANIVQWIAASLTACILLLATHTIRKEQQSRKQLFTELEKNNSVLLFNQGNQTEKTDEQEAVNRLIVNLEKAKQFINSIGEGKYDVDYQGLNQENITLNQHTLAGAMVNMRDQMIEVAEAERKRKWTTEGLAKFADILRANHENIQVLYDSIIANLIKYLNANQGGLFVVNDTDEANVYVELVASYAYNRKKHIEKKIEQGEGLIGQVLLEKEMIYMTDIPDGYLKITSGLGEALPKHLLVVPLKVNEEVYGALELASFYKIEDYQLEFLQKLSESIASTISMSRVNIQTRKLLEESQQQAEEMRAQEEEVRQNMEELSATQEDMQRVLKEAQAQEAFMNDLIDSTSDTIIAIDRNYKIITCNKATKKGYQSTGLQLEKGFDIFRLFSDEQKQSYKQYFDRALAGEVFEVNDHYQFEDRDQYFAINYSPLRNETGNIIGASSFAKDITETVVANQKMEVLVKESQQQAEEMRAQEEEMRQNMEELSATQEEMQRILQEVQAQEAFMKNMINATADSIITIDKDYRIILCNQTTKDTYSTSGLTVDKGFYMLDLFQDEQKQVYKGYYDRALAGEYFEVTESFKLGDTEHYYAIVYSPLKDGKGEVAGAAIFGKDITETITARKKVEAMLAESQQQTEEMRAQEEELRQNMEELSTTQEEMGRLLGQTQSQEQFMTDLINATTDTIFTIDQQYNLTIFNETFRQTWEPQGMEVKKGVNLSSFYKDPQEWKQHESLFLRVFSGEHFTIKVSKQIGEKEYFFNIVYSPIRNQEGEVVAAAVFGRDITALELAAQDQETLMKESQQQAEELKAQEEELRQNMEELSATQEDMERVLRQVKSNEQFMQDLIDATTDTVFTIDTSYRLIRFNKAFHATWMAQGYDLKAGDSILNLFDEKSLKHHKALWDKALAGEFLSQQETVKIGEDEHIMEVIFSPLHNDHKQVIGLAVFAKDVTEKEMVKGRQTNTKPKH